MFKVKVQLFENPSNLSSINSCNHELMDDQCNHVQEIIPSAVLRD